MFILPLDFCNARPWLDLDYAMCIQHQSFFSIILFACGFLAPERQRKAWLLSVEGSNLFVLFLSRQLCLPMAFLVELLASVLALPHAFLLDLLGLSTRPLVLLHYLFQLEALRPFTEGALVLGILSTCSLLLIFLSVNALCASPAMEKIIRACSVFFLADGLLQAPGVVFCSSATDPWPLTYPTTHTGLLVVVEIFFGLELQVKSFFKDYQFLGVQLFRLYAAACSRFMAARLVPNPGTLRVLLLMVAAYNLYAALVPKRIRDAIGPVVKKVWHSLMHWAGRAASCFHRLLTGRLWSAISKLFWRLLENPWVVELQSRFFGPLWRLLSPWLLPVATATITTSSCRAAAESAVTFSASLSPDSATTLLGQAVCGVAAVVSTVILALHAASRLCGLVGRQLLGPLDSQPVAEGLLRLAAGLALPWKMSKRAWRFAVNALSMFLSGPVATTIDFAVLHPLLALPVLLFTSGLWYYLCFASQHGLLFVAAAASAFGGAVQATFGGAFGGFIVLQQGSFEQIADSTLVVGLCAVAQVGTFAMAESILFSVRAVRGRSNNNELDSEELNTLANAMRDPRQCGRCAFGPIDHAGCNNLATHHGQVTVGRPAVSNACPRCRWFVSTLSAWPKWDGLLRSPQGRRVFRLRAWGELVVCVRAAAKAMVLPFALLRVGNTLRLPRAVTACLALAYLLVWLLENASTFSAAYRADLFLTGSRRLERAQRRQQRRRQLGRRLRGRAAAGPQNEDEGQNQDAFDCGAGAGQTATLPLPPVTTSEALRNVLEATPERVYMGSGELCAVCLEEFPQKAVDIAASSSATSPRHVARELRQCDPPVVALRCGHPLHVNCAEAAVASSANRHVRCPLCREPVSLGGAVSARMFG